jgi:hypothetical protein
MVTVLKQSNVTLNLFYFFLKNKTVNCDFCRQQTMVCWVVHGRGIVVVVCVVTLGLGSF